MKAALITEFRKPLEITEVPQPIPPPGGVVLRVGATGICLSDWHAWMGHETLPSLPHVPGHEMAGVIVETGAEVKHWQPGDRVTVPFSVGCGTCTSCRRGHLNTCDSGFTPGFSAWGSFAQFAAIDHADLNLVRLPDTLESVHAAALGCRFITAFRAVVDRGRIQPGEWMAVHGCGGVGLSAVMIAAAKGAQVIAVDIADDKLRFASELGATETVNVSEVEKPHHVIRELTDGGAQVSIDAVGTTTTALNSIKSVAKHGRHIQVGLLLDDQAVLPVVMERVIMGEMEILGSRGMPATDYPRVFDLVDSGTVDPGRLVTDTVPLEEASDVLATLSDFGLVGTTVIDRF